MNKHFQALIFFCACIIALILHIIIFIVLFYFTHENEGVSGIISSTGPPVSFYTPQNTIPVYSNKTDLETVLDGTQTSETVQPAVENIPTLPESVSSIQTPSIPSTLRPDIPKASAPAQRIRSSHIRQAQWQKGKPSGSVSTAVSTSASPQPFKKIVNIKSHIITKTIVERALTSAQKDAHAASLQSFLFIKELYNKKVQQKCYEHCKFTKKWSYITKNIKPITLTITCIWDRKGKLISYQQLESSGDKQMDDFLKEFFSTIPFPAIPPQLPDPSSTTCRVYLQKTPQGFTELILTPLEQ